MKTYEIDKVEISGKRMVRDMSSKAVLNNDLEALKAYRDKQRQMLETINQKDEINSIKADMDEVKKLLHVLLERMTDANK